MIKRRIIAFIILIAMFIVPISAFADTYGLGNFVNEYRHYMVAKLSGNNNGGYQVFCTNVDDPSEIIKITNDGKYIKVTAKGKVVRYYTEDYGVTWSSGTQINETTWGMPTGESKKIMESTFTVYQYDGRVFFSPIGRLILALVETMKGVDSGMLLRTISAGLIPLVGLVVLVICFNKGWDFLHSRLMR